VTTVLPDGRLGRLLACGLTLAVPAVLALGVVAPVIDLHADRAEAIRRQGALVERMEVLAARLPTLREQAAAVDHRAAANSSLLAGDTDATASASLQDNLQSMFRQAAVTLNTVETLPGEDNGHYRRIRLRISITASWPALAEVLKLVSAGSPALYIDELQVQPALHKISSAPGSFDVTLAIFGFRAGSPTQVSAR
jgi:general secretion pathway protein M